MIVRFFNTYEPVTTLYRDLLPYLVERGNACEVLISGAQYRPSGRGSLADTVSNPDIHIKYLPAMLLRPTGRVQKALIMLVYSLGSMGRSLLGSSTDVNVFLTQPPLFSLWGWILLKLRRQPYVCIVMDIYPDVAVMGGMLHPQGLLSKLFARQIRFAWDRAAAVIVIGRCMAERVKAMGVAPEKIHLITNWSDPDLVYPISPSENNLRQQLCLVDKFLVLYSGNMGVSHDFDDLLEVILRSRDNPGLHFVFIGGGLRRKQIETFVAAHQLRNVTMLPFQPMERLAETLSLGDVHYISLRAGFEGLMVPSKAYGALAAGRPVIYQGEPCGEIARMISEKGVGVVIPPQSPDELERVIRRYREDPELANKQGQAGRELSIGDYAPEKMLERYHQIISTIVYA